MVNDPLITGFHTPMGVASSGSQLFITDLSVGCISACTTSGQVVNSGLVTGLTDPRGIAVDSTGHNLFVTLPGYVGKYDTVTGQGTDRLITLQNFPLCVAVVGTNLFVTTTDGTGGTIEKYDTDGNYLTTLVSGLNQPYGVTLDAAGQFLYTGTVDGSVWEYSATTGNLIKQLVNGSPQTPYGLAVDGSDLYVVTGAMGQPSHVGKYNLATDEWNPYLTTSDSGMIGIALATVPEPGTAGLVLLGLGWLGYRRIRTA